MLVWMVFVSVCLAVYNAFVWFYKKLFAIFVKYSTRTKAILAVPFLIVAITPLFLISSPFLWVFHPDWGTYSEGYRMGMIHDWGPDRQHFYDVFATNEGQMFLGYQSTAWTNPVTGKEENPWKFSSSTSALKRYEPVTLGRQVVVHYRQVLWQWNMLDGQTDYRVIDVAPIDPSLAPDHCGDITENASGYIDRRSAPFAGRLVKSSTKGNLAKSYEQLIQLGDSGGKFRPMSILDPKIKECADLFVRSGVMAVIHYDLSRMRINTLARDTNYNIIGIERVK